MVMPVAGVLAEQGIPVRFVTGHGASFGNCRHASLPVLPEPFSEADFVGTVGTVVAA
jgi:hypothetical protein